MNEERYFTMEEEDLTENNEEPINLPENSFYTMGRPPISLSKRDSGDSDEEGELERIFSDSKVSPFKQRARQHAMGQTNESQRDGDFIKVFLGSKFDEDQLRESEIQNPESMRGLELNVNSNENHFQGERFEQRKADWSPSEYKSIDEKAREFIEEEKQREKAADFLWKKIQQWNQDKEKRLDGIERPKDDIPLSNGANAKESPKMADECLGEPRSIQNDKEMAIDEGKRNVDSSGSLLNKRESQELLEDGSPNNNAKTQWDEFGEESQKIRIGKKMH